MHDAQFVPVRVGFAVQICTPGEPLLCVQRRTSCSRQRQLELGIIFQTHSLGASGKQYAVADWPQSGTLTWQSAFPAQVLPKHCSVVGVTTDGWGVAAPH